jgi:hypothetical protein
MRFLHLDLDTVLTLDPQADQAGRRLVRLIAGNPVTMAQMTRHCRCGLLRAGYHPDPGTGRRRHPGRLRHRHHRHRALPERPRLSGRPAAGHRSPPSPAPRDRHTPNRPAAVPDHVVAQPRTAPNASPESRRTRADRACRRGRQRRSDDHESNQHHPSIRSARHSQKRGRAPARPPARAQPRPGSHRRGRRHLRAGPGHHQHRRRGDPVAANRRSALRVPGSARRRLHPRAARRGTCPTSTALPTTSACRCSPNAGALDRDKQRSRGLRTMTCRPHGQRHDGPFRDRPGRRAGP